MRIKTYLSSAVFILFFSIISSFGAVDQTFVERILKDNRDFVDFIDICVTNFTPDKKNDLFTIYQKHFNAEVAFLQGDYKRAFDNVYDSQKDMVTLYELILTEHYLEDSKNILDGFAPEIIKSKNVSAKQYLTLGYRDRTLARTFYISGEASHPKLYSYKLYKYVEAINMARRAKRYAFISLYTGQDSKAKLKIYNQMFKSENEKGGLFFKRFVDKNEKDFILEMNKSYEEYEKDFSQKTPVTEGEVKTADTKSAEGVKNPSVEDSSNTAAFEKKMERSVRFRKEQRVAQYLLNGEFDKAETIIRSYVDDYNFKLILATFNALSSGDAAHTTEGGADTATAAKKDYKKFIQHHNDNYNKLNGKSVLDSVVGDVKVIDAVKKEEKKVIDEEKIEGKSTKVPEAEVNKKLEEASKDATKDTTKDTTKDSSKDVKDSNK